MQAPFTASRNCTIVAVNGALAAAVVEGAVVDGAADVDGAVVIEGAAPPDAAPFAPTPTGMAAAVMQLPTVTAERSAATLSVIVVESV